MTDAQKILNTPMVENDAEAATIRGYLKALLSTLWEEGEGFSGKRPFGNSDWEFELYRALVQAGHINGTIDEYGDLDEVDKAAGNKVIFLAIEALD
jgi:hypothetical protein